jgi:TPP-dependent 2-oxoacid decarboxylase
MIFRKNIIPFIILLSLSIPVSKIHSQTYSKTIKWKNNRAIKINEETKYIFDFENAGLSDYGLLPIYSDNIDLKNTYSPEFSYSVKPENLKFIVLNDSELNNLSGTEHIQNSINFESHIVSDRGHAFLNIRLVPFRKNSTTEKIEKLVSFDINIQKQRSTINRERNGSCPESC